MVTKYGHSKESKLDNIHILEADHPVPDAAGVSASKQILQVAEEADERSLVICCISGGGSALLTLPAEGISLKDLQQVNRVLLACGASIDEMNTIRKHLSAISGGRLASAASPATVLTLVLSDVVGDPLSVIASGPTVPDEPTSTFGECIRIVRSYGIRDR